MDIDAILRQVTELVAFKNHYEPMLREIASEKARFDAWKTEQVALQQKAQEAQVDDPLIDAKEDALDAIDGPQDAPDQPAAPIPPAEPSVGGLPVGQN